MLVEEVSSPRGQDTKGTCAKVTMGDGTTVAKWLPSAVNPLSRLRRPQTSDTVGMVPPVLPVRHCCPAQTRDGRPAVNSSVVGFDYHQ